MAPSFSVVVFVIGAPTFSKISFCEHFLVDVFVLSNQSAPISFRMVALNVSFVSLVSVVCVLLIRCSTGELSTQLQKRILLALRESMWNEA